MAQDKTVDHFEAVVHVSLTPVNRYGDKLDGQEGEFSFKTTLTGSLAQVVGKVDRIIKEA